jgi:hypothetical protein
LHACVVQGRINRLETAFVQGNMIRYVHIPDTVNIERDTARHVSPQLHLHPTVVDDAYATVI